MAHARLCKWQLLKAQSKICVSVSTLLHPANKMGVGEKPGWVEVPHNLVLSGSTTRQSPKNQQLSGEAEQGREQTTTATTRNTNWEQQQLLEARRASLAGSRAQQRQMWSHSCLLQAPELRAGHAHSRQAPRALFVTVPTPFAP